LQENINIISQNIEMRSFTFKDESNKCVRDI